MLLSEYLDKLDSKKAVLSAVSFFDLPWRQQSGAVHLKLIPGKLEGVPAEVRENCVVAKDALHFLNIYRAFAQPASVKDLLGVLDKTSGAEWSKEPYAAFHLRMYGVSFCHLKLMESRKPDGSPESGKDSKIVFLPVFSLDDEEEQFVCIQEHLGCYQVEEVKGPVSSDKYLGLNVFEGFQSSRGEQPEAESMVSGYGF